ncbi:MAG: DivIVA domain-containing protein, partial [Oscillospiraceae bacterium]|nr:DivIVA domain-containing protein [Oscillospiraceae bacterium]
DNQILKGKLKVLVEKVEEYRSTEDAMRMALLTAQRMGDEITKEANRTKDELLKNATAEVEGKLAEIEKRTSEEEQRLVLATAETAKFLELSQAIVRKHAEFLDKLDATRNAVAPQSTPVQKAKKATKPGAVNSASLPRTARPPAPAPAPQVSESAPDDEISGIAAQIGSAVEKITNSTPASYPISADTQAIDDPQPTLFSDNDDGMKLYSAGVDEAPISPRPKFDFDDLKFGANFDTDD